MNRSAVISSLFLVAALVLFSGCNSSTDPLAAFQPEIANNTDNFQFQVTGVTDVTATVDYMWQNTGKRVTINQSSTVSSGTAIVTLFDPNNVQRYTKSLSVNGTFQSDSGLAGTWRINVALTNLNGTLNFRCQKL